MNYQGDVFVKYDSVLKSLRYDNHREKWFIARILDEDPLLNDKKKLQAKVRTSLEYENRNYKTSGNNGSSRILSHTNLA